MKIKGDFVTNSSSTAYVFCIPKTYQFTKEMIDENVDKYEIEGGDLDYDSDDYNDKVLIMANKTLEELKNGNNIHMEHDDMYEYELLRMVSEIIPEEFCITGVDVDSNGGELIGVKIEDIKKVLEYEDKK